MLPAPKIRWSLRIVSNWSIRTRVHLCLKGHHFKESWSRQQGWQLRAIALSTPPYSLRGNFWWPELSQQDLNRGRGDPSTAPPRDSHELFSLFPQKSTCQFLNVLNRIFCGPKISGSSLDHSTTLSPITTTPLFSLLPSPLSFWGQVLLHGCWWPGTDYGGQANLEFTKIWLPLPPKGAEMTDVWMYATVPDIFFFF